MSFDGNNSPMNNHPENFDPGQGYGYGARPGYGYGEPQGPAGAGGWRRLGAFFIDSLVIGAVILIMVTLTATLPPIPTEPTPEAMEIWQQQTQQALLPFSIAQGILFYLYSTILETTGFSTLGKRLLGIKVVNRDGGKAGFGSTATRNLWKLIMGIPIFGGILFNIIGIVILVTAFTNDSRTQAINDKLAGSLVLKR